MPRKFTKDHLIVVRRTLKFYDIVIDALIHNVELDKIKSNIRGFNSPADCDLCWSVAPEEEGLYVVAFKDCSKCIWGLQDAGCDCDALHESFKVINRFRWPEKGDPHCTDRNRLLAAFKHRKRLMLGRLKRAGYKI